jgi:hypothetical protein
VLEEGKLFLVIKENLSISRVNPGARGGETGPGCKRKTVNITGESRGSRRGNLEHLDSPVILTDFLLLPGTAYSPRTPGFTREGKLCLVIKENRSLSRIQVLEEGKLFLVIKENLSISRVNPGARGG